MNDYTDRRKVRHNGAHVGDVAKFGPEDYRTSSADDELSFATRDKAERWLKARHDWPDRLRDVWQRYQDAGYCVMIREGQVLLFSPDAPRHCLATPVDNGRWIQRPAMFPFVTSHLYEDMAGAIEERLLPPWQHVSANLIPSEVENLYSAAKDCYCYQGVDRCDFCTGKRAERERYASCDRNELIEQLTACGWEREGDATMRFNRSDKGKEEWAAIHGLGSAAGMRTLYRVNFGEY